MMEVDTHQSPTLGLFNLPLEIREVVYALAISDMPQQILWKNKHPSWLTRYPAMFPSFCFASRQMSTEILPVLLREYEHVLLDRPCDFQIFLKQLLLNERGFQSIWKLTLRNLAGLCGPNLLSKSSFTNFMSRFPALQHLGIEVNALFVGWSSTRKHAEILTPTALTDYMHVSFDSFFFSNRLRTLRIVCIENQSISILLKVPLEDMFSVFIECLKEEMRNRRSAVTLEIEYYHVIGLQFLSVIFYYLRCYRNPVNNGDDGKYVHSETADLKNNTYPNISFQ
ncbi:hypothetical protein K491DRAFT_737514 [Lophiostoma macrostomum CBS 122681]|uniref:F-box domain-containing protein n=1 Tax=Lophiostoma macrostomum CBS 122681 TaxID=1314788 RepID=A0A6A6SKP3_9PLEO|nr:hypothetical protein K491DRAFT_737514 [Lophiostoma macrostomum CBS 122681]